MSILQKIQEKRAELREQAARTKMTAKEKIKGGWVQMKDFILVLYLLNTLIGQCQKIDIMEMRNDTRVQAQITETPQIQQYPVGTEPVNSINDEAGSPDNRVGTFYAYTASEAETDSNPTIMASGRKVYPGAIANNCLDFGTKVKVNGVVKVVEDRMNSRYDCDTFDIFMEDYSEAIEFGKRELNYQVL